MFGIIPLSVAFRCLLSIQLGLMFFALGHSRCRADEDVQTKIEASMQSFINSMDTYKSAYSLELDELLNKTDDLALLKMISKVKKELQDKSLNPFVYDIRFRDNNLTRRLRIAEMRYRKQGQPSATRLVADLKKIMRSQVIAGLTEEAKQVQSAIENVEVSFLHDRLEDHLDAGEEWSHRVSETDLLSFAIKERTGDYVKGVASLESKGEPKQSVEFVGLIDGQILNVTYLSDPPKLSINLGRTEALSYGSNQLTKTFWYFVSDFNAIEQKFRRLTGEKDKGQYKNRQIQLNKTQP